MTDQTQLSKPVKIKKDARGTGFPKLLLQGAIEVIEQASKYGKQWNRQTFANFGTKKGKGSTTSGAFRDRLASLQDYGLIVLEGDLITRSEVADKIVKPINTQERDEAIKQAFFNPGVFKQIIDSVSHGMELQKDGIVTAAINQFGVSRSAKDKFLSSFVESGKYAGIIRVVENGNIVIELPQTSQPVVEKKIDKPEIPPEDSKPKYGLESATTLGTTKRGEKWEVDLNIQFNLTANVELFQDMSELVLKAEALSQKLRLLEQTEGKALEENTSQGEGQ